MQYRVFMAVLWMAGGVLLQTIYYRTLHKMSINRLLMFCWFMKVLSWSTGYCRVWEVFKWVDGPVKLVCLSEPRWFGVPGIPLLLPCWRLGLDYNLLQWCQYFVANLSVGDWVNVSETWLGPAPYGLFLLCACLYTEEHVTWFQKKYTSNIFRLGAFIKVKCLLV